MQYIQTLFGIPTSSTSPSSSLSRSPSPSSSSSSKIFSHEDYFLQRLQSFPALWDEVLSQCPIDANTYTDKDTDRDRETQIDNKRDGERERRRLYICCPPSASLNPRRISLKMLKSHVLQVQGQGDTEGEGDGKFTNLLSESVRLLGNYLILDIDSADSSHIQQAQPIEGNQHHFTSNNNNNKISHSQRHQKRIKVLHADMRVIFGRQFNIFYVSQPFVGGINAPEDFDDIGAVLVNRYVAALRCYPTMERVFVALDAYLSDLRALDDLTGGQGLHLIRPSLAASLRRQWMQSTTALINLSKHIGIHCDVSNSSSFRSLSTESFAFNQYSDDHFGQIVESQMMKNCGACIYKHLVSIYQAESDKFTQCLQNLRCEGNEVFKISPHFVVSQDRAICMLQSICEATTPVDKLLVMRRTVQLIHEAVDELLWSHDSVDYEFATDDLISILLFVIVAACDPIHNFGNRCVNMVVDLHYCQDFHFCTTAKSANAFINCHFEVALNWIMNFSSHVEAN